MKRIVTFLILCIVAVAGALAIEHSMLTPCQSYNGRYGYVNSTGKFMIQPRYDDARNFREHMGAVEINGKWGFVNERGRQVVPCKYSLVMDYNMGYAVVRLGDRWGALNSKGELEIPCEYSSPADLYDLKVIKLSPEQIEYLKKQGY